MQVLNTALLSAQAGRSFTETLQDREVWGRKDEITVKRSSSRFFETRRVAGGPGFSVG